MKLLNKTIQRPAVVFQRYVTLACVAVTLSVTNAAASPVFDVITSSGDFNGGLGAVLRFSGQDGSFLGNFAGPDVGATDPRDVVLSGAFDDPDTRVFVNTGTFPNEPINDRVLVFATDGTPLGVFADYAAQGLDTVSAGGGVFGPNGNYFVGSRSQSTVLEFDGNTGEFVGEFFPPGDDLAFPRGFVVDNDGTLFIGNGADPVSGGGGGSILEVSDTGTISTLVDEVSDPGLSPLDVILSPDGQSLVVSSQFPFQDGNAAAATIRVYDVDTGALEFVLDAGLDLAGEQILQSPRGLGFGPDGLLYASSTGNGRIVRFDFENQAFIDIFAELEGLNGQALNFIPVAISEPQAFFFLSLMAVFALRARASSRRAGL